MDDIPGKVQAIGVMTVVAGALAGIWTMGWFVTDLLTIICCAWLPQLASPAVAIVGLLYGIKALQDPFANPVPRWVPILMIVEILAFNVPNAVLGIVILVFSSDPEVQAFYAGAEFGYGEEEMGEAFD